VLVVPLFLLSATVVVLLFAVFGRDPSRFRSALLPLTLLFLIATFRGLRHARRRGDRVMIWEPELWAPWRRRVLGAGGVRIAFSHVGRTVELILKGRKDVEVTLNSYSIGYDRRSSMLRDAQRAALALDLPAPQEDAI
jgi:hypothetical protein